MEFYKYYYKKYLIIFSSIFISLLFIFVIYRSYRISLIKKNMDILPIIKNDNKIIKIKKDNRILENVETNSFYKKEVISKSDFERKKLDDTVNDTIVETHKINVDENNETTDKYNNVDSERNLVNLEYDATKREYVQKNNDNKELDNKELIINNKEDKIIKEVNDNYYKSQLIALKNKQQAINFVEKTKKTYASILKNLDIFVSQIDLNEKGVFYRVRVGNFNTKDDATKFCSEYIKISNKSLTNCIVTR